MINKFIIQEIIDTWLSEISKKQIIPRDEVGLLRKYLPYKHIVALSGIRRSGKTYLFFELIQELIKQQPQNICYINFEDERFSDGVEQLDLIYKTFLEYKNPTGKPLFFFDEIQNIKKWEKWLARMYEKDIKFFVSGSNASLLSSEFSKSLTGRHKLITIFPLSFYQFVSFKKGKLLKESLNIIENQVKLKRLLQEYTTNGGLPEIVFESKKDLLMEYYKDILARDIILRENIKFKQSLKEIALILLTNISRYHSLYSLNKVINARSVNTVKNYLSYLENAYLVFRIPYFTYSLKEQLSNPFKIYAQDTGLRNTISYNFSQDLGWLYENIVAIKLLKDYGQENIFYWKNDLSIEVDFLIRKGADIKWLIQVCYQLNEKTKKRELEALIMGRDRLKCNNLLVVTSEQEGEEFYKKKRVQFIPLWKWLLEK